MSARITDDQLDALFNPRGVLVAGASTHPGKFGFVSLHNLLASGYQGKVFATNRDGAEVLGVRTVADIADLPDGEIDLVFVCTPASYNPELLRAVAAKGVKAAFLTSAGYGEAGEEGRRAQDGLIALAESLGVLSPARTDRVSCRPWPSSVPRSWRRTRPPAASAWPAESGNFVSSFMNWSTQTGVGISRAVSAGNAAMVTVPDYLGWYAGDDATKVGLAYLEGITDGRAVYDRFRSITPTCHSSS